jgi:multiple antibiotic resistance protein
MEWRTFGQTLVTLLVIMDPIGNAPVFVALTRDWPPAAARRAALDAVGAAAALVVGFALFGQVVLDYLRVSLESLSIAGGLLLLIVALEMLRGDDAPDMHREPPSSSRWRHRCSPGPVPSRPSWCSRASTAT